MSRIAIIGAGPAGLSLARLLVEQDLHDITLYEASDSVGGTSESVFADGRTHELGAGYPPSGRSRLTPWMQEAGHTFRPPETFQMDDGRPLAEFVYGDDAWRSRLELAKYLGAWAWFHVREALGLVGDDEYARLAEPFGPWLRRGGMDAMHRLARRSTVAMGQGFLDETSRLWGYRWNTLTRVYESLTSGTREPERGWETFWASMAERFHVKTRHRVVDMRRTGREVRLRVEVQRGDLTETHDEAYDHVVVAVPLTELESCEGATADELWVAEHLESTRYATTLIEVEGWFDEPIDTRAYRERLLPRSERTGGDQPLDRTFVARRSPRAGRGSRPLYVVHQYVDPQHDPRTNPEATDASLRARLVKQLREDLAAEGAVLKEVLEQRIGDHSPRLTKAGIAAGGPSRLERMQGRQNVWYTGSSVVHESIDHVVDYNAVLALRIRQAIEPKNLMLHSLEKHAAALAFHGW